MRDRSSGVFVSAVMTARVKDGINAFLRTRIGTLLVALLVLIDLGIAVGRHGTWNGRYETTRTAIGEVLSPAGPRGRANPSGWGQYQTVISLDDSGVYSFFGQSQHTCAGEMPADFRYQGVAYFKVVEEHWGPLAPLVTKTSFSSGAEIRDRGLAPDDPYPHDLGDQARAYIKVVLADLGLSRELSRNERNRLVAGETVHTYRIDVFGVVRNAASVSLMVLSVLTLARQFLRMRAARRAVIAAARFSRLTCPSCEYDLRGLLADTCPECGVVLAWTDEERERAVGDSSGAVGV